MTHVDMALSKNNQIKPTNTVTGFAIHCEFICLSSSFFLNNSLHFFFIYINIDYIIIAILIYTENLLLTLLIINVIVKIIIIILIINGYYAHKQLLLSLLCRQCNSVVRKDSERIFSRTNSSLTNK